MPSPTGTNYAGRFLPASFPFVNGPTMAMDSAMMFNTRAEAAAWRRKYHGGMAFDAPLPPATIERILKFVASKLSPHDFAEVRALMTKYDGPPENTLGPLGQGGDPKGYEEEEEILRTPAFPDIARIAMDGYGMQAPPRRAIPMSARALASFEERFPDTKRIGH
jgi:hypothetical protein